MTLSMYQATVPVFARSLKNLRQVLEKGEAHAKAANIAPEVLLESRLIDDMLPLVRNVQIATDMAKNGSARLAAVEPLKFEDNETTFAELYARIERAIDYVNTFAPVLIDGSETRKITFRSGQAELNYQGKAYLTEFLLPNFFFHCTTSYAILRKAGVELGKKDFLGLQ